MMFRRSLFPLGCAAVAGALSLASCGGSPSGPAAAPSMSAASSSTAGASPTTSPAGTHALTLRVAHTRLGDVVTGPDGKTLYRFDKDKANPPTSNCSGDCASTWPPVAGDVASVSTTGIDMSLVGSVTRADGTKQLTLHGWPLYSYSGDAKPGDTAGDGVQGSWHAIAPNGDAVSGGGYSGY